MKKKYGNTQCLKFNPFNEIYPCEQNYNKKYVRILPRIPFVASPGFRACLISSKHYFF